MEKIRTHNGNQNISLKEKVLKLGALFPFLKFAEYTEKLFSKHPGIGDGTEPAKESVEFKSNFGLAFPASDIQKVDFDEAENQLKVVVNFLGMGGPLGPLPISYTEFILNRVKQKDRGLRAFLDMFNNRMVAAFYQMMKHHRRGFTGTTIENDRFSKLIFGINGLGNDNFSERMQLPDRALLANCGTMSSGNASISGLSHMLSRYFKVKIRVKPFVGQWKPIPDRHISRLGLSGKNNRLGTSLALGTKAWLQQHKFDLLIGPLTFEEYCDFLPDGKGYAALRDFVKLYVGGEFNFDFKLILKSDDVPVSYLSARPAHKVTSRKKENRRLRLGWDFRLNTGVSVSPVELSAKVSGEQHNIVRNSN